MGLYGSNELSSDFKHLFANCPQALEISSETGVRATSGKGISKAPHENLGTKEPGEGGGVGGWGENYFPPCRMVTNFPDALPEIPAAILPISRWGETAHQL